MKRIIIYFIMMIFILNITIVQGVFFPTQGGVQSNGLLFSNTGGIVLSIFAVPPQPDINLSFGPPDISVFRFEGCGPDKDNVSAMPQGQNITYGIDYICNNGTGTGDVDIKLSSSLNTGWSLNASTTSISSGYQVVNTSWLSLTSLANNVCSYVWFKARCLNVTVNPGAYEQYRIS